MWKVANAQETACYGTDPVSQSNPVPASTMGKSLAQELNWCKDATPANARLGSGNALRRFARLGALCPVTPTTQPSTDDTLTSTVDVLTRW